MPILPNVFIVGFQRCGSTALASLLDQHANVYVSNPKESFALVDPSYEHYNAKINIHSEKFDWLKVFGGKISEKQQITIEASVCNFYQNTAFNYIKELNDRKVIFVVRNPIDRLLSVYRYAGLNGIDLPPSYTVNKYIDALFEGKVFSKEILSYGLSHGCYETYIQKWKDKIGEENISVIGFKSIINCDKSEFESLHLFLGIPDYKYKLEKSLRNESKPKRFKALNKFARSLFSGTGLGSSQLGELYSRLNIDNRSHKIHSDNQNRLEEYYAPEFSKYTNLF